MSFVDIIAPIDSQEGTKMVVQSWMKEVGSTLSAYEPLVEVETDKVTMEIEAPADGVLVEILIETGAEIEPGTVLGRLSTQANAAKIDSPEFFEKDSSEKVSLVESASQMNSNTVNTNKALSPSVKRLVIKNKLDVEKIIGSGRKGRITLGDVKKALASKNSTTTTVFERPLPKQQVASVDGLTRIQHTGMRRAIAKHMHESVTTAPHVTAVFEADFSAISAHRAANKAEFASKGVKLTYTTYMIAACVEAMNAVPEVNSQWHDDYIEVFSDINIGVGTALGDKGLIVPVIMKTQEMNLFGIAKSLQGSIDRARENKLKTEDVRGGTFTISNHGVSGSLLATPIIINQPQSAILGVGKLEKRAVVKTVDGQDMIAIRPMAYVSLTIDHRVLDGDQTNTWLSAFVKTLENWKT